MRMRIIILARVPLRSRECVFLVQDFDHLFSKMEMYCCYHGIVHATYFPQLDAGAIYKKDEFRNHVFSVKVSTNKRSTPRGIHAGVWYLGP